MRVTTRTHAIALGLYSLPFLAVLVFSMLFAWAGNVEMIVASAALLPVLLYLFGLRWCRYVVGGLATISFLLCSIIPMTRGTEGKYFWLIWAPIWLAFGFTGLVSFIPPRERPDPATTDPGSAWRAQ